MFWDIDTRKWTDSSFVRLKSEEKVTLYEDLDICEAEHLFVCLAAFHATNRHDWRSLEADWKRIGEWAMPDVPYKPLASGAFVKGFFDHYKNVHGVKDLRDLISRRILGQPLPDYDNLVLELVRVEQDIEKILGHVTIETAYSKEVWKSLGWDHRLKYGQYKRLVRAVVEDTRGSMVNWKTLPNDTFLLEDIKNLKALMECVQLGKNYGQQMNLLKSDIKLVSKFASFTTLISEECYKYLGRRLRMLYPNRNRQREQVDYIRIVVEVVKESYGSEGARKLREGNKSRFFQYIQTRQEIVTLRRIFGYNFNRFQRYLSPTEENAKLEFDQRNSVAVFIGICHEIFASRTNRRHQRSVLQVIETLRDVGVLDDCQTNEVHCQTFLKVVQIATPKYFFTNNSKLQKVKEYVKLVKC